MPRDPYARAQARLWLKRVDELHQYTGTLTTAVAFRRYFMRQVPDGREAYVARKLDSAKRDRLRTIMEHGLGSPDGADAAQRHDAFIGRMEEALSASDYLVGDSFTLADAAAIPYVNRCNVLGLSRLWEGRRPRVADWYARMQARPIFNPAITAWWDDDARERFDVPRDEVWRECAAILKIA